MKVRFSIFLSVLTALALISCVILSGCENNENNSKKDKEVVSVTIHETGGEGGTDIEWKVYSQNDVYYLSCSDNSKSLYEPAYDVFEITQQEYEDIMGLDYEEDEDVESFWKNVADSKCFRSTITYKNGEEKTTDMIMENVTSKLNELLRKEKIGE